MRDRIEPRLSIGKKQRGWLIGGVVALGSMTLHTPADVVTVTSLADSGPGSLRQVIAAATAGETITFSVTGTIVLTSGELVIDKDLTIDGPGAGLLSISGNDSSRVLSVGSGVTASILGVTVRDGMIFDDGAGIHNQGTLTLSDCSVQDNESHSYASSGGGGVFNSGSLTIDSCNISGNLAHFVFWGGGGILNTGTLHMVDSTLASNDVESGLVGGAGMYNTSSAAATIWLSTISDNTTDTGTGGGIYSGGDLTVVNSTLSNNSAVDYGGGIHNDTGGTLAVLRCTLTGNCGHIWGGGVYNNGTAKLANSTLSGNFSYWVGGAGFSNISGTMTLSNCLVTNNCFSGVENLGTLNIKNSILADSYNCLEPANNVTGVNFATDNTCGPGFTIVTPAQLALGPLADNGGPTWTHALLPGSVAIDAAVDCTGFLEFPVVRDQRGVPRQQGPACDVGPFELVKDGD